MLSDIDIRPGDAQSVGVGLGEEYLHVVYQEYRDDVTGIERVGLMYTHGPLTVPSWDFQYSIGDDAKHPQLEVLVEKDEDRLVMAWIEGQGKVADIVTATSNAVWSDEVVLRSNAPGVSHLSFVTRDEGIFLYHDEINVYGPVSRMGLVASTDGIAVAGLSNMLFEGYTFGVGQMEGDTIVCTVTPSGSYSFSKVVSLDGSGSTVDSPDFLDTLFEYLPGGSDEVKLRILGLSVLLLVVFLGIVVVMVRRSHNELEELEAQMEHEQDTVELMITPEEDQGPLLSIEEEDEEVMTVSETGLVVVEDASLATELEKKLEEGDGNARLERRMKRKQQREMQEMAASLQQGLPPIPLPLPALDLPAPAPAPLPLPDLKREAQCPSCQASFAIKDLMLKRATCPVCQTKFDL